MSPSVTPGGKTGLTQTISAISESKWFSNLTVGIIIFYAAILGFRTIREAEMAFGNIIFLIDYAVTIYFVFEVIVRIGAEEKKTDFFKNGWNLFDFIIVLITVIPIEQSEFAAVARMMRVFRVLRLFTARPELKRLIDMLVNAIPSILDIVLLMFIIFYIYAVIGSFIFAELPSGLWNNFLTAMLTLFRVLTFEDWTDVMYEAMEMHSWAWAYFVSFVIIAAFVFFNLFVAVIIGEMQKLNEEKHKEEHDCEHKEDIDRMELLLREIRELKEEVRELRTRQKDE